jgi:two-component system chemotaxis sensor kinase CheA
MDLDLAQFHASFFEESFEALDSMEAALLKLDVGAPEPEGVNTVFRVAHSIKGGAGMFGFKDVASFTHTLETLLDELRSGRMQVTTHIADQLLLSVDVLRAMMSSVQRKEPVDMQKVADLQFDLEQVVAGRGASAAAAPAAFAPAAAAGAVGVGEPASGSGAVGAAAVASGAGAGFAGSAAGALTSATGAGSAAAGTAGGSAFAGGAAVGASASAEPVAAHWAIVFRPLPELLLRGNDPLAIFASVAELGKLHVVVNLDAVPRLRQIDAERCYLTWELRLESNCSREQVDAAFEWAVGDCEVSVERVEVSSASNAGGAAPAIASVGAAAGAVGDAAVGGAAVGGTSVGGAAAGSAVLAAGAGGVSPGAAPSAADVVASSATSASSAATAGHAFATPATSVPAAAAHGSQVTKSAAADSLEAAGADAPKASGADAAKAAGGDSAKSAGGDAPKAGGSEHSSIRVSIEKIDELINTVGELVITQAMLSELGRKLEGPVAEPFRSGLTQLERNMRELQESVMRVRMLPISFTFSRFPRMVRDLAQRLGKQIELKMTGEHTELDKTVLEKIGDPLVHLVRNSVDHGIESAETRVAAGKSAVGVVHLDACHRGGNIAVEIRDDGGGLDKTRILAKAKSRGLVGANEALTEEQIHELIFLPGFSTAEKTTDVSGRGVGMDVVRRNVKELGGKIEIRSESGKGSRFIITLPLTLAIVDGQSVSVGGETYIVPLTSIIESLQLQTHMVGKLSGRGEVFSFRGDYLPIVRLHDVFAVTPKAHALHEGLIVVAEGDGRRIGLFVDELLGQQQVVIKSMETNYGTIDGVAGATILGDGAVALILDLPGLIRVASQRAAA